MYVTLSVLMANFNHAAYLRQSIEAMVRQERTPDEFVILDDCSTDNSVEIIESYRARYPFLRLIRRETNVGAATAYDELLNAARCDYVYTAAADDYVLPGFFDRAMAAARQHPQAGIIFGKMIAVNAAGQKLRDVQAPRWTTTRYLSPSEYLD
jgi:glycosyltransferase involved in cell wall biosynthesis